MLNFCLICISCVNIGNLSIKQINLGIYQLQLASIRIIKRAIRIILLISLNKVGIYNTSVFSSIHVINNCSINNSKSFQFMADIITQSCLHSTLRKSNHGEIHKKKSIKKEILRNAERMPRNNNNQQVY